MRVLHVLNTLGSVVLGAFWGVLSALFSLRVLLALFIAASHDLFLFLIRPRRMQFLLPLTIPGFSHPLPLPAPRHCLRGALVSENVVEINPKISQILKELRAYLGTPDEITCTRAP